MYIPKGKFHGAMINTTPRGSATIPAVEGKVNNVVLTCKLQTDCLYQYCKHIFQCEEVF